MSDAKRIQLTTLEPARPSDESASKKATKTIRLTVILSESNEDECPEYNYKDELAAAKKRLKVKDKRPQPSQPRQNGQDPFGGEDDDENVRRLAAEMEAKYGGQTGKKRRKGRKDDYADIGMGYDESDSFIDNTDGYDEIIPQNVTTLLGGFYINSGALEFKTDEEATSDLSSSSGGSSSESEDGDEGAEKKPKRKRILSTSEEDDEDEEKKQGDKAQPAKKKLSDSNKIQMKKRRLVDPLKKTVKELLREKREDLNMTAIADVSTVDGEGEGTVRTAVNGDAGVSEPESHKENKKPMSISSVADAIESVVKATLPQKSGVDNNNASKAGDVHLSINKQEAVTAAASAEGESSHKPAAEPPADIVKLPENLPSDILAIINGIIQAAISNTDGKVKFFNEDVNLKLLTLERKCKCLGRASKNKVYDHLSAFVGCRKETLMKRAKNLMFECEQKTLKRMLAKLKGGIDAAMPGLLANYELESRKVLSKKFSAEEDSKHYRMPHRRFHWTEDLRRLLKEAVGSKKRCLMYEGRAKEGLEEVLVQFLRAEVKVLWPEGWMSEGNLRKTAGIDVPKPVAPENNNKKEPAKSATAAATLGLSNSDLQIIAVGKSARSAKPSSDRGVEVTVSRVGAKEEHQFFNLSETIKLPESAMDHHPSSVIVEPIKEQIIDLTEKKMPQIKVVDYNKLVEPEKQKFPKEAAADGGDDIQKVMESLKALQKMSSPSKNRNSSAGGSSTSAVPVIAFNSSLSPKGGDKAVATAKGGGGGVSPTLHDDFQRQLFGQMVTSTPHGSKGNFNRCS